MGTIFVVNRDDGSVVTRVDPFESDRRAFVAGPLTVDPSGNVYYNVVMLDPEEPWKNHIRGAFLVKVTRRSRKAHPGPPIAAPAHFPLTCFRGLLRPPRPRSNAAPSVRASTSPPPSPRTARSTR
jgi:hypothetical protein